MDEAKTKEKQTLKRTWWDRGVFYLGYSEFHQIRGFEVRFSFLAPTTLWTLKTTKEAWDIVDLTNVYNQIKHLLTNVSIAPLLLRIIYKFFVNLDYNLIKNGYFHPNIATLLKSYRGHWPCHFYYNMSLRNSIFLYLISSNNVWNYMVIFFSNENYAKTNRQYQEYLEHGRKFLVWYLVALKL